MANNNNNTQKNGLLPLNVEAYLKVSSAGEIKNESIKITPVYLPSIGTNFSRVVHKSEKLTESFFVKKFEPDIYDAPAGGDGLMRVWRRTKTKIPPAQLEHLYMQIYRQEGCPVPFSQVVGDYTLAMADCGEQALEERLRGKNSEEQETILVSIIPELAKIAVTGRKIKIPSEAHDRIDEYSQKGMARKFAEVLDNLKAG